MKNIVWLILSGLLLAVHCKNEPAPTTPTQQPAATLEQIPEINLPQIAAITKEGNIQLTDGTIKPIPHYGEPGYLTLLLVRYCEKDKTIDDNPPLTAEGQARAERLGRVLDNAVLDKIASINTKHSLETAQAVRRWAGDPVMENFPFTAQNDWLLENLENGSGKRILFVGQQNSVPLILNNLTASIRYKNIPENDFGRFYIAVTAGVGKTEVMEFRY
jgi:2,3-bisphosphoglycerate-dependent phosphoglycerate mutase